MLPRKTAQTNTNYIYTWNPDWKTFQYLALEEKIRRFTTFAQESQVDFATKANNDENALCLIIAPDLIFTPAKDVVAEKPYTPNDLRFLEIKLLTLQAQLDKRTAIIAGSMSYLIESGYQYKVTSFVVTPEQIFDYDKKASSNNENWLGLSLTMQPGEKSGIFEFCGRRIGLEICQDHEAGTLKQELNGGTVDIHVLIANGQNIRRNHITTDIDQKGLLTVCELEPGKSIADSKRYEESAVYSVINSFNEAPAKVDAFRLKFLRNAGSVTRTLSTTLVKPQSHPIGKEGKLVINRAKNEAQENLEQQTTKKVAPLTTKPETVANPVIRNFFGK